MSRKKISTTVYITEEQSELLKSLNEKTKVPIAEFIRQGIDLILEKNKFLDVVRGKVKKPTKESSDADKVKYRELEILAMTLMVECIKDNLVPYISNIDRAQDMYEALKKLFNGRRGVFVPGCLNYLFKPIYAMLPLSFKMYARRRIKIIINS